MTSGTALETVQHGPWTMIQLKDPNVDFRNCEAIKSSVAALVANGQAKILLNLAEVGFMDSSGLGVLLFCKRTCEEGGGQFAICGLQQYVQNLVTLTNLNKALTIYPTETQAL